MPIGAGGGSKAGDIRAGGAVYTITGVDHLSGKLARVQANTAQWANKMKGTVNEALQGFATGVSVAGLTGVAAMVGKEWVEATANLRQYIRELERAAALDDKIARNREKRRKESAERIEASPEEPRLRFAALSRELQLAERESQGLLDALNAARKAEQKLHFGQQFMTASIKDLAKMSKEERDAVAEAVQLYLGRGLEAAQQEAKQRLKEAEKAYADSRSQVDELTKSMGKLREEAKLAAQLRSPLEKLLGVAQKAGEWLRLQEAIKGVNQEVQNYAKGLEDALSGKSAERQQLDRFEARLRALGASGQEIANLRGLVAMQEDLRRMEEESRLKEIPKRVQEIRHSIAGSFGGGNLAQLFGAGPGGIQQRQLEEVKKLGSTAKDQLTVQKALPRELGNIVDGMMRLR